jgi:hypothetical protein
MRVLARTLGHATGVGLILLLTASAYRVQAQEIRKRPVVGAEFAPEAVEFFEARVRPILVERCVKCHGPRKQSSGLRLDSREGVLKGGESGPTVIPRKPEESRLIRAISQADAELKMPPSGKLPGREIATLRQWVSLGVPWGVSAAPVPTVGRAAPDVPRAARAHWAFQPVRRVAPPRVKDPSWVRTPIDAFVLAQLESAGIAPSTRADRRILIRRATIDLLGIPPTAEEIEAFEADGSCDAYARLIDRLLASPRYGERWGRHWLDVARFADTKGYVFTQDRRYPYAYTYRDYVVWAFNSDLGYDQFIRQQIAGDQLSLGSDRRPLAAMGFLTVGRRFLNDQNEIIDDRIDVICRGLLGLTVTCARCHDHKFDPIPSEDYYSLFGVFASSVEPAALPVLYQPGAVSPQAADYARRLKVAENARDDYLAARRDEIRSDLQARFPQYFTAAFELDFNPRHPRLEERALAAKLNSRRLRALAVLWKRRQSATSVVSDPMPVPRDAAEWETLRRAFFGPGGALVFSVPQTRKFLDQRQHAELDRLDGAIAQLDATHPGAPSRAMVLEDAPAPVEPHVFLRGDPGRPGKAVPRRFLRVLTGPEATPFRKGSGRLELAEAIAAAQNPLTPRVLVNRIWQWHFGKGLVGTPSDFGTRSEPPSHPELLDYLASELVASGWSLKALHRRIMLSSTYQERSDQNPLAQARDPENRLLWRFNRQRLDFEAMHDSILAVAGALEARIGGPPGPITQPPHSKRRALYGFIDRQNLDGVYRTFDFAAPDATSPRRFVTTVPQQALFLMNSPFLHQQACRLGALLQQAVPGSCVAQGSADDSARRVQSLYRRVLGRWADPEELTLAADFIRRQEASDPDGRRASKRAPAGAAEPSLEPWAQLAQVLLLTNEFMFVD